MLKPKWHVVKELPPTRLDRLLREFNSVRWMIKPALQGFLIAFVASALAFGAGVGLYDLTHPEVVVVDTPVVGDPTTNRTIIVSSVGVCWNCDQMQEPGTLHICDHYTIFFD